MIKKWFSPDILQFDIPLLILSNFIANFLFIRGYSLYSDDWSAIAVSPDANISYLTLLLDAQRPLLYVTDKFVSSLHMSVFSLQVAGFLLSSILLVLFYLGIDHSLELFQAILQIPVSRVSDVLSCFLESPGHLLLRGLHLSGP